jgi:acyl-CoA synthetase (AMP-forming)/AMP-acid ligase II
MTAAQLRTKLQERLERSGDRILLRIATGSNDIVELTGPQIVEQGLAIASRYAEPGSCSVLLLLLPHSAELFLLQIGLVLAGNLPAILAWPTNRIDPEKYQRNLLHQLRNLPAQGLITLPQLANNLAAGLPYPVHSCSFEGAHQYEALFKVPLSSEELVRPDRKLISAGEANANALFLQFSGGTTGPQKCVVVSAEMLEAQMELLAESLGFSEQDGVVSWLPLYHDMGLIACLWFPLWHLAPSFQFAASDWLLNPGALLEYMDRYRGTFCWLPNFAFAYLAQQRSRMSGTWALGHVRGFINCSEPVRQRSIDSFAQAFADWGLRRESIQASYAMAENVFAVTQTPMGELPATFPRKGLGSGSNHESSLAFNIADEVYVSSGRRLRGMEIRIFDETTGTDCPEEQPGEILLRTPCLFEGYWGEQGFSRHALSADGWYSTGDYGFLASDELYVIGRKKDIIIVGGQNIFPEDVEVVGNTVAGLYPGRVVAFGLPDQEFGTESLAIVAEMRGDYKRESAKLLERQLTALVLAAIGVAPRRVAVVPERWIVKSTAGKISRRDTRERFQNEFVPRTGSA